MERPRNLIEHSAFIEEELSASIKSLESYYNRVIAQIKNEFTKSQFFDDLKSEINNLNDCYLMEKSFSLLDLSKCFKLDTKKFKNMMNKCYRKDVLFNKRWDDSDKSWINSYEWVTPLNCFEKLNDILRTRIMIRYLDGAELVLDILKKTVEKYNYSFDISFKADEYGYYGVHFVLEYPIEIARIDLGTKNIKLNVEIQICTQISEVINELLHRYYEKKRMQLPSQGKIGDGIMNVKSSYLLIWDT